VLPLEGELAAGTAEIGADEPITARPPNTSYGQHDGRLFYQRTSVNLLEPIAAGLTASPYPDPGSRADHDRITTPRSLQAAQHAADPTGQRASAGGWCDHYPASRNPVAHRTELLPDLTNNPPHSLCRKKNHAHSEPRPLAGDLSRDFSSLFVSGKGPRPSMTGCGWITAVCTTSVMSLRPVLSRRRFDRPGRSPAKTAVRRMNPRPLTHQRPARRPRADILLTVVAACPPG